MNFPIASPLGKKRFANCSSTIATALAFSPSRSSNVRPRSNGIFIASKYRGPTTLIFAVSGSLGFSGTPLSRNVLLLSYVNGSGYALVTVSTPGRAPSASRTSLNWLRLSRGNSTLYIPNRNVSSPCGSNPGLTFIVSTKLRISSPEPASNTTLIAISVTTNPPCTRRSRRPLLAPRPRPNASAGSTRDALHAGSTPKHIPVINDTTNVNASVTPSIRTSCTLGKLSGTITRKPFSSTNANATPPTPATHDKIVDSINTCLTICLTLAPNAVRTENSLLRTTPRATSNPATFTQAISSTPVTEPKSSSNGRRTSLLTSFCNGVVATPK